MKKRISGIILLLFTTAAFAADFGAILGTEGEYTDTMTAEGFSVTSGFNPWFSWDGGKGLSFYASGLLSLKYTHYNNDFAGSGGLKQPAPLMEFSRFALSYRLGQRFLIEAGRIPYTDSMAFTASGLFDGLRFSGSFPRGDLTLGAYYTGLLYKETARIMMTPGDMANYAEPCSWDNFGAFFAPRRTLAALRWDLPLGDTYTLSFETLYQFDLTGDEAFLHSQYGEILFEWFPLSKLGLNLGAVFEAMEGAGDFNTALGGLARLRAEIPGSLNDSLTVGAKFSTGPRNGALTAFVPLSVLVQGSVFTGTISGLAPVSAVYTLRLHRTLLLDTTLGYFFSTVDQGSGGRCYGGEGLVSLAWQPLDDLKATLGGGLFFPGMGNIYPDDTGVKWKITAGLSLSL